MFDSVTYLLILILLSNSLLLVGGILNIFFLNKIPFNTIHQKFFLQKNILTSFIFLLSTCSFLFSSALSLFSIPLFLLFCFYFVILPKGTLKAIKLKRIDIKFDFHLYEVFLWNLICITCFLFFFLIFRLDKNVPHFDFLYFAKLSRGISESSSSNLFSIYSHWFPTTRPMLYHYSDLWILALISRFSNLSEVKLLIYVVYPFLTLIVLTIIKGYVSIFFNKYTYIISFGILFGLKVYFPTKGDFIELSHMYRGIPFLPFFKLLPIYICLLSFGFFYRLKSFMLAYFFLAVVAIVYPTTIPALAFFSLSVIILFFTRILKNKYDLIGSFFIFSTIVGVVLFQKIFQYYSTFPIQFQVLPIKTYIVLFFETYFKIFSEHFLIFILFIFFVYFNRNNIRNLFDIRVLLFVFSTIGSFVFVYTQKIFPDNNQIISNISPVLLIVLFLYLIEFFKRKIAGCLFLISLLFSLVNISHILFIDSKKHINPENRFSQHWIDQSINILSQSNVDNTNIVTLGNEPFVWYFNRGHRFHYVYMYHDINPPLDITVLFNNDLKLYSTIYRNDKYPPLKFFGLKSIEMKDIYSYLKMKNVRFLLVDNTLILPEFFIKKLICRLKNKEVSIFELI